MISDQQRDEIKLIIINSIEELELSQRHLRERLETVAPDSSIGRLSRMDSMVNKGTVEMALSENQKKLTRLRGKLERIDDSNFGMCASCGVEIPMERLRAAPDRGVCKDCLNQMKK